MKTLIAVIVLVLVAGGIYWYRHTAPMAARPAAETSEETSDTALPAASSTPAVKTFNVSGRPYSFTPSSIEVNKGDTVRIVFTNEEGMHDWVIDEFNARTGIIKAGESQTIEFVADKTGSFEYYCSVGTHRQMGMKGTLTVK